MEHMVREDRSESVDIMVEIEGVDDYTDHEYTRDVNIKEYTISTNL